MTKEIKRVLVDMDGVLADFERGFLDKWHERYPDKLSIPSEDRTSFFLKDQYPPEYTPLIDEIYNVPGFFRNLMPMPGALTAFLEMDILFPELFICTSPMPPTYKYSVFEKFEWVEENLGPEYLNRLIISSDKTLVQGNILIDDKPKIEGVEQNPSWEHILYAHPFNRGETNKRRLTWDNWKSVLGMESQ